jgi:hypothetical protein
MIYIILQQYLQKNKKKSYMFSKNYKILIKKIIFFSYLSFFFYLFSSQEGNY